MTTDDDRLAFINSVPPPTFDVTLGRSAWRTVILKVYAHMQPGMQALLDAATPDEHGRLTLTLPEDYAMQVLPAIDDAVYDQFEEDQVL